MTKKAWTTTAVLAVLLIAVVGVAYKVLWNGPSSTGAKAASVRLAWVYDMAEVGVFVAQRKGYFRDEGLDVKIEPGGFGLDPFKLVAAGTNDFGVGGAGNLLMARAQGVPVVAIAAEFQNTPVGFIVKRDSGIRSIKEFAGKRVGVQTGTDTDVLYRALLARNKMTSSVVSEVPIQFDMTPFVSGAIDVLPGYVTNQPVTLESRGMQIDVISAGSQGLNYYGNVFFTTESMLKNHPDTVQQFVRGLRKGWTTAMSDKAAAVEAVHALTKDFEASDLNKIYEKVMPFIKPDQTGVPLLGMDAERWKTTRQVLVDAGLLKGDIDLAKAYTLDYVK